MNNCACIYVGDFDPAEFYNARIVIAKKKHKCGECGKEILPSSKYEYVAGSWEGIFSTNKTCFICLEIRNVFFCDGWFFGQIHEHLWEHIQEMDGKIEKDCLCDLSFKAKGVVYEMIARVKMDLNENFLTSSQ
jgi:hypothetical protein